MARTKEYDEGKVIIKAMDLFWRNGYHSTSMQMLETEMGINKFSIYSSFKNKRGVFLECLEAYKAQSKDTLEEFKNGTNGVEDIKRLFYIFADNCYEGFLRKGCLLINTGNEISKSEDEKIYFVIQDHMKYLKKEFIKKLRSDSSKNEETILNEANYLLLAKHGLATASRIYSKKEINNYIELVFKNI